MKLSAKKVQILANYFRSKPVKAVYLFGSWARGDADCESDIDLLLERDFDVAAQINIPQCQLDLKALLSRNMDLFQHHKLQKYWRPWILKESILIYKKQEPI